MGKKISEIAKSKTIEAWHLYDSEHDDFEIGLEKESRHKSKNCAYIKSIADREDIEGAKDAFGHLVQNCGLGEYRGKRIAMTAWVKSELGPNAIGRLEFNIFGKWGSSCKWNGTFDNMSNRPIIGSTDWTKYTLVVDAPQDSYSMCFGLFQIGVGKMWLDEINLEIVDNNTPLTGLRSGPTNLNFTD